MRAFYSEWDPYAAAWLRNLIKAGLITPGEVDERSILDIRPSDLVGFDRVHFFAGIGVWDYALNLAGWGSAEVWTGSCPCQPFSAAGKRGGTADERHLWPAFFHLIRECRPATVFGEQVASKDGLGWLDLVQADLEGEGYAVGAADLCAPGDRMEGDDVEGYEWLQRAILDCPDPVLAAELRDYAEWARGEVSLGAPNIRQRLWFVAHANGGHPGSEWQQRGREQRQQPEDGLARIVADSSSQRRDGRELTGTTREAPAGNAEASRRRAARLRELEGCGAALGMANAAHVGRGQGRSHDGGRASRDSSQGRSAGSLPSSAVGRLDDASGHRLEGRVWRELHGVSGQQDEPPSGSGCHSGAGFWIGVDWIPCRDSKVRPVESGSFPLVDGASFRMGSGSAYEGRSRAGMLKGYGNAINAQRARAFIEAVMQVRP